MRRRGPGKALAMNSPHGVALTSRISGLSAWPFELNATESVLLDRYIQRFSNTYPAFSGPTNPFLTVLLPLAMQCRVVLDSLLALSAVQSWENGSFGMGAAMLRLRQKALGGCRQLLSQLDMPGVELKGMHNQTIISVFASCMLLLLFEKLAGEGQENWSPHLSFIAQLCSQPLLWPVDKEFDFLLSLFWYNDLVRSTSLQAPTLSDFYLTGISAQISLDRLSSPGRFAFPCLIARISSGDPTVTDAEISAWDGRLDWFPSFALVASENAETYFHWDNLYLAMDPHFHRVEHLINTYNPTDQMIMSELYRIAGMVYRRQRESMWINQDLSKNRLALWAVQLVQLLPEGSPYESTLLWPIGIVAKELTLLDGSQRAYILLRLNTLERQFHMKHFSCVVDMLLNSWSASDAGIANTTNSTILLG
ncbi:hypothetical protein ASPVEDRAFT_508488 [Aspergillus versicolor CBS 583.65]|uniref:Transcription factor domain-containing protein n=1 Tax=Aspergillus versicolor CBS 583.65 TaxID=1036611 RepID=A0A1L9PCT7_ASPVE|nr:uncharacterized protein ASPVEDRAFT_508488 [Aspergillus versicolor CBS 583.65]OJI99326.1 hypothetical protein ASPVEDRAFT_508488 [Aspergillus versicolor CBS 583.65]